MKLMCLWVSLCFSQITEDSRQPSFGSSKTNSKRCFSPALLCLYLRSAFACAAAWINECLFFFFLFFQANEIPARKEWSWNGEGEDCWIGFALIPAGAQASLHWTLWHMRADTLHTRAFTLVTQWWFALVFPQLPTLWGGFQSARTHQAD